MMRRNQLVVAMAFALLAPLPRACRAADVTSPYPGTITLDVDLTQTARNVLAVHETIPVQPGPLTLYYPKWIPGDHAPDGPIANVAGFAFTANGKTIAWHRDTVDMYSIHLDIPEGATRLQATFEFLSPLVASNSTGEAIATPNLVDLEWNDVVLYPSGYASRAITINPTITLPRGWQFATALLPHESVGRDNTNAIHFAPTTLNTLIDAPVIAGRHFKQWNLAPGAKAPVYLDAVADAPGDLAMTPAQLENFRSLVQQEKRMFRSRHYRDYRALFVLSDYTTPEGLEHHQSSENRTTANYFTDDDVYLAKAGLLLTHEFTHSWNGKFRRPRDLWTPDFNSMPMKGDLLWVYEGLTEYWANVMAVRSGVWTPAQFRQAIAMTAASMDHVPGRSWDSSQNVANAAQLEYYVPAAWASWRPGTNFYPDGILLWLDVDTKIRELSRGQRSLDDFARLFYGMDDGSSVTRTYTFDDVVAALNRVQPYAWTKYLRAVLDSTQPHANLAGLPQGGWKLAYSNQPSSMWKAMHAAATGFSGVDATYSAGFQVDGKGQVVDVLWNGPAFRAGMIPGMDIKTVDSTNFSPAVLNDAIRDTANSRHPLTVTVTHDGQQQVLHIDYHGGLRYPTLERVEGTTDYLDRIAAPLKN